MKFGAAPQRAPVANRAGRRLLVGLLVSLLLHGVILLLQFGVPGIGTPGATPPLTVRIANADPALAEQNVEPPPAPPADSSNVAANVAPPPLSGMRLVDPVSAPAPPPPAKAKPKVKQDKPRRARRISPPLPALDTLDEPTKVITQDSTLNDFAMPVVRPEEAEQKTVDIKDAQAGEDDGDAVDTAALEAEAAKAGRFKAEQKALSQRQAEEQARIAAQESARLAELEQQRAAALLEQQAHQVAEAQSAQQRAQQVGLAPVQPASQHWRCARHRQRRSHTGEGGGGGS